MFNIGTLITLVIIVYWVVRAVNAVAGNKDKDPKRQPQTIEDWGQDDSFGPEDDEYEEAHEALAQMLDGSSGGGATGGRARPPQQVDLSQLTMAERIEMARQRARERAGGVQTRSGEAAESARGAQTEQQVIAQKERLEKAQADAERQRISERRRAAQQKADIEQRKPNRSRKQRQQSNRTQLGVATGQSPSSVKAEAYGRVHDGHLHTSASGSNQKKTSKAMSVVQLGALDAATLRKAFVLKELLDKPIAMRKPQDDLLS